MTVGHQNRIRRKCPMEPCDMAEYAAALMFENLGWKISLPAHGMQPDWDFKIELNGIIEYVQVKSKSDGQFNVAFGNSLIKGEIHRKFQWLITVLFEEADDDKDLAVERIAIIHHLDLEENYDKIQNQSPTIQKSRIGIRLMKRLEKEYTKPSDVADFRQSLKHLNSMEDYDVAKWVESKRLQF